MTAHERRREVGRAPHRSYVKLAGLVLLLLAVLLVVRTLGLGRYSDPTAIAAAVSSLRARPHAAPLFVAAYAVGAALALPGSVLTIAGGAIFGFRLGLLLNWIGATIGATLAFLIARALGQEAVRRLLGDRAAHVERLADSHGFRTVLRLRLIPVVPFNMLNYAAGLAGVPLRDYVVATMLGLIPVVAVYTWFADALVAGAGGARHGVLVRLLIAGGLLVLLSFVPAITRRLAGTRER